MKAKKFLTENSDWFDKSPGGEKLYFESEVIRMMNEYANEALRIHDVVGRSEELVSGELPISCVNDFEKPEYCSQRNNHLCKKCKDW